ncbi:L-threonylcarbamoyladenylate synthase [Beijerinckia indica]|uniref:Threonylcarbamoyl-AMP synthase n=1 Tax=Beijerinckia indica subsp. indica (strain ATCC 9039 / DSM 1715 / NCIMB 8712) TaxID=395963 RepID=B2IF80_BEII9|nr:L-threonylcarbamoyladenylate synthase [Beijerinckia indica]ACB95645.1 Sua5/YciO/YrdC/YwlC family protein [Beijerinckia indica subsp. indica ATCC 9039]
MSVPPVSQDDLTSEITKAASILRQGGLVAFPTETVYGLGADATRDEAVAKIYAAKERPSFNPLIAHVASLAEAQCHGIFSDMALRLAACFWPGPLTLVVPVSPESKICALARAGLDSVALRVPAHPIARALIEATGLPLAAPSANRSGRVSPVSAEHVREDLGDRVDLILDGGRCPVGVESTIIDCLEAQPRLLRPGGIPREAIETCLGRILEAPPRLTATSPLRGPGLLASHYAPRAKVRLDATDLQKGEAGLDFGGHFAKAAHTLDLSPSGDLTEAAAHLFTYLRHLDALGLETIAVAPIPETGLGEAINDRLRRAAAPRHPAS